jgi:hypothetical protein
MRNSQAKAVCVNGVWRVVYSATGKVERCHNRATAQFLERKFNQQQAKRKPHGISKEK